jgi:hypothetical protein
MSHDAAEHGIHVEGNLWACETKDEHGFTCLLDEGHEGDHEFPASDPVEDIEDPVEAFIEENER